MIREIGLASIAAPFLVALAASWLVGRSSSELARRYQLPLAAAIGVLTGLVLLLGADILAPMRHWQWLGWLSLGTVLAGALVRAPGLGPLDRALVIASLSGLAAWSLVPTWKEIETVRWIYLLSLGFGMFVLALGLASLPRSDRIVGLSMVGAALAVAGLIAASVSLTYAQVALMGAFGLLGAVIVSPAADLRSLAPFVAVFVGGMAFVGFLEPRPPLPALLLVASAPLALWVGEIPALRHRGGILGAALRLLPVILVILAGCGSAFLATGLAHGG